MKEEKEISCEIPIQLYKRLIEKQDSTPLSLKQIILDAIKRQLLKE